VYVGVPRDMQTQEIEVEPLWTHKPIAIEEPEPSLLDRAAQELQKARELAELLSIPMGTSPSHKGLISELHPLSLGVLGFGAFPFAHAFALFSPLRLIGLLGRREQGNRSWIGSYEAI